MGAVKMRKMREGRPPALPSLSIKILTIPLLETDQVYRGFHGGWRWEKLWRWREETGILGLPEMRPSSP